MENRLLEARCPDSPAPGAGEARSRRWSTSADCARAILAGFVGIELPDGVDSDGAARAIGALEQAVGAGEAGDLVRGVWGQWVVRRM